MLETLVALSVLGRLDGVWRKKPAPLTAVKATDNKPGEPGKETYSIVTGGFVYTKTDQVPATGKSWFKIETKAGADPNRVEGLLPDYLGALGATGSTKWIGSGQGQAGRRGRDRGVLGLRRRPQGRCPTGVVGPHLGRVHGCPFEGLSVFTAWRYVVNAADAIQGRWSVQAR
uniref:Uncharacterized protein n=1 Tax=Streptomyces sp. NBC_00003 TaxID=2903608 RepID=A0AAU2V4U8_9ACTN